MRFLVSFLLLLAGLASIAYSYLGTFVELAGEFEHSTSSAEAFRIISEVVGMMAGGEFPQLPGFLAGGLLLIAGAVFNAFGFFGKRSGR